MPRPIVKGMDAFTDAAVGWRCREMKHFLYLLLAIVSEVIATSSLKASQDFSRLCPALPRDWIRGRFLFAFPQPEADSPRRRLRDRVGAGYRRRPFDRSVFMG